MLPALLAVGLVTRFPALEIFGMTMVIRIFVLPAPWFTHRPWAVALPVLAARGPGAPPLDHIVLIERRRAPHLRQ